MNLSKYGYMNFGQFQLPNMTHTRSQNYTNTITIFVNLGFFRHFETVTNTRTWIKITQILENVVRCKYFEAGVHIENSYQDGLGRTTQTLHHVVVVHILI